MIRQHTVVTPYSVGASHFYSAELEGELVLFDTGSPTEEAWQVLSKEVDLSRLKHLFVTHWHVDHCGQIGRIQLESDADIYLSQVDAWKLQHQKRALRLMANLLGDMGFDSRFQKGLFELGSHAGLFSESIDGYKVLETSAEPARLGISYLKCAGHSQSDIIFQFGEEAVSGDILLPNFFQTPLLEIDLTTLVGRFDNYAAYCDSLAQFASLRGARIHPGHRDAFDGPDEVVRFYVGKLRERSAQIAQFSPEFSVREIVEELFGDTMINPVVTFLKASEVVFMQDFLARPEQLATALHQYGFTENRDGRQLSESGCYSMEIS